MSTIWIAFLDQNLQSLKQPWFYSISWYIRKCKFLLENDVKSIKLQKNAQTHANIQITRATRHLKAQTSYFSTRMFLGTIVVPMVSKNDMDWIGFLNKNITLTYKWSTTAMYGTPVVPKIWTTKLWNLGFPMPCQPCSYNS